MSDQRPYMTVIPGRYPQYKAHLGLTGAKAAVALKLRPQATHDAIFHIFEWKDDHWEVLYEVNRKSERADLPWRKESDVTLTV